MIRLHHLHPDHQDMLHTHQEKNHHCLSSLPLGAWIVRHHRPRRLLDLAIVTNPQHRPDHQVRQKVLPIQFTPTALHSLVTQTNLQI